MQSKFSAPLRALRQVRRYAGGVPTFSDPPCVDVDPNCHYVGNGGCETARSVLKRVLPACKYLDEMQQAGPPKCCISRVAHRQPCRDRYSPRKQEKPPKPPFRSMWEPPCRTHEQPYCKDLLPRFDDIYYRPSNKCRCYTRTWVECPRVKLRVKKVCCLDGIEPPEVLYRPKERCPKVACKMDYERMRNLCKHSKKTDSECRCPKMWWPCCKPARCNPHCAMVKHHAPCIKLRAPYPSYSETKRRWERPKKARECQCREPITQCEVLNFAKRRLFLGMKTV